MARFKSLKKDDVNTDIDLAPMLALMVTLIPILLLSSVFVRVTMIETELPQVIQQAIKNNRKNKNALPQISLYIEGSKKVRVSVLHGRKKNEKTFEAVSEKIDEKKLYEHMVSLKRQFPEVFRIEINPSNKADYDSIVKVLDQTRRSRKELFPVKDKETGKMAETSLMFPDVVFANFNWRIRSWREEKHLEIVLRSVSSLFYKSLLW